MSSKPAWLEAAAKLGSEDEGAVAVAEAARERTSPVMPRSRITGRSPIVLMPDAEEADLAWRGYSVLAMIPSTVALALGTVSAIVLIRPLVPAWIVHETVEAPLAAIWVLQTIRALYRFLAYDYRVTSRRLNRSRGPLYPPEAPLDLATVVGAEIKQTALERLLGVGTVQIVCEDTAKNVDLEGVRRPKVLAARIDEAAKGARERNVTAARV